MIIGIDIGGTKISVAQVQGTRILEQRQAPSPIHNDLGQLLPTLEYLLQGWIEGARGIGIACTGLVSDNEVLFLSVGADQRLPLPNLLRQATGLPVLVLNDAWAATWGEYRFGAHPGNTLAYVTVSTGIGGGVVQNGKLLTAHHGFAAHVGHLTVPRVNTQDIPCHCGRNNCVEAIASGTAIARRAEQLGHAISCREVFIEMPNQPALQALIADAAGAVAEMLANLRALTGTDSVVLGGSIGLNPQFRKLLAEAITELPSLYRVELRQPALGANADLIGAALALHEQLETP